MGNLGYFAYHDVCSRYNATKSAIHNMPTVEIPRLSEEENTTYGIFAIDVCDHENSTTRWLHRDTWATVCWMQNQSMHEWNYEGPVNFCTGTFSPYRIPSGFMEDDLCGLGMDAYGERSLDKDYIGAELCPGKDWADLSYEDWNALCEQVVKDITDYLEPNMITRAWWTRGASILVMAVIRTTTSLTPSA